MEEQFILSAEDTAHTQTSLAQRPELLCGKNPESRHTKSSVSEENFTFSQEASQEPLEQTLIPEAPETLHNKDKLLFFLFLFPSLIFFSWLASVAISFLGLVDFGHSLEHPMGKYALCISSSLLFFPWLVANLGSGPTLHIRLREALRAALISFFIYHLLIFALAGFLYRYTEAIVPVLFPPLLDHILPGFSCLLMYISCQLITYLLPQPVPASLRPVPVKTFGLAAILLICLTLILPHAPQALHEISGHDLLPLPYLSKPLIDTVPAFLFLLSCWYLYIRGQKMFRPVFVGVCIAIVFFPPGSFTSYPWQWQFVLAAVGFLSLFSIICLYRPLATRWLVPR